MQLELGNGNYIDTNYLYMIQRNNSVMKVILNSEEIEDISVNDLKHIYQAKGSLIKVRSGNYIYTECPWKISKIENQKITVEFYNEDNLGIEFDNSKKNKEQVTDNSVPKDDEGINDLRAEPDWLGWVCILVATMYFLFLMDFF